MIWARDSRIVDYVIFISASARFLRVKCFWCDACDTVNHYLSNSSSSFFDPCFGLLVTTQIRFIIVFDYMKRLLSVGSVESVSELSQSH